MAYFTVTIEKTGNVYTGWLDDIKGLTAQGTSIQEVKAELIKLYQIKKEVEKKFGLTIPFKNKNLYRVDLPFQFNSI